MGVWGRGCHLQGHLSERDCHLGGMTAEKRSPVPPNTGLRFHHLKAGRGPTNSCSPACAELRELLLGTNWETRKETPKR